jgi:hypothetical protein
MIACPHLVHGTDANGGKSPGINTLASQPGQVTIFSGFSLSLMALQLPLFRSRPDPVANLQSPEAAACSSFTSFVTLFRGCVKEHSRENLQFQRR